MRTLLIMLGGLTALYLLADWTGTVPRDDARPAVPATAVAHPATEAEKMIDERFDVADGEQLSVSMPDADVQIETGTRGKAHIEVFLEARNMDRARAYFEQLDVRVDRVGRTVRVESRREDRVEWAWRRHRDGGARIRVVAHIPENFDVDVRSSDGDVTMDALTGRVEVRTSDGDIRAASLRGPSVSLHTSDGDVEADELNADKVSLRSSDGDLRVRTAEAALIEFRTSDGDIEADALSGEVEIVTSDGDIDLRTVQGREVSLRTSDGDVRVDDLQAGRSEVTASDGSLYLRRVEGDLRAVTSSGDIAVHLAKAAEVTLRTSDGDIEITLASDQPADVMLRGERVHIAESLGFRGQRREAWAEGRLNGGGPRLEARTGDGRVTLRGN